MVVDCTTASTTASQAVLQLRWCYDALAVKSRNPTFAGKSTATARPARSSSPGWSNTPSSPPSPAASNRAQAT